MCHMQSTIDVSVIIRVHFEVPGRTLAPALNGLADIANLEHEMLPPDCVPQIARCIVLVLSSAKLVKPIQILIHSVVDKIGNQIHHIGGIELTLTKATEQF